MLSVVIMKFVKEAFGWKIYKLEDLKEYGVRNDEWIVEYYIALKDNYTPVEGRTVGNVLEKMVDVDETGEKPTYRSP